MTTQEIDRKFSLHGALQRRAQEPADQVAIEPASLHDFRLHSDQFAGAVRKLPGSRAYALDEIALRGGVALLRGTLAAIGQRNLPGEKFVELLKRISRFAPDLYQSWKPKPESATPKPWRDEVTGDVLPNPFAEPLDTNGQAILRQREPDLAEYLKRLAENPYALLAEIADAKTRRDLLNALDFSPKDFENNPFRFSDQTAIHQFIVSHPEWVCDIWRQEASPVKLPWTMEAIHRTHIGFLVRDLDAEPVPVGEKVINGQVILHAGKIDSELREALRKEAQEAANAAAERADKLARKQ